MIRISGLSKSYGAKQVLRNIDLHFLPGKIYGVVGENGAGKTTLFKCMAGLEQYTGSIEADKTPLKDQLGYLQTEPFFFSKITGREYIQLLCNARGMATGETDERNIFDLPLDQYAITYSTGMKKKLALTAILLQQNDYFILDEPFNGVDIQSNILITDILETLRKLGKTLIISSHIFSTLSNTCDEICLLRNGSIERKVSQPEFAALEKEMKEIFIGNKIDKLGLS